MTDPMDFDDVAGEGATLDAHPPERLFARWSNGPAPLAAGAALARKGDARVAPGLLGVAAFVAADDIAALRVFGPAASDALAAAALCAWAPMAQRAAAAEALAGAAVTSAGYAALAELAGGPKVAVRASAERVLADVAPQAAGPVREAGERWRLYAKQLREGKRNPLQRQELQRAIAAADVHPVVGLLLGDDGGFLAGVVPPIDDAARGPLLPYLLAAARTDQEALRVKVFGVFQRRWRDAAAAALSAVARTPTKAREAGIGALATRALAAMGAAEGLVAVTAYGGAAARVVALGELAKLMERGGDGVDGASLAGALARAGADADAQVGRGVAAVRAAMG